MATKLSIEQEAERNSRKKKAELEKKAELARKVKQEHIDTREQDSGIVIIEPFEEPRKQPRAEEFDVEKKIDSTADTAATLKVLSPTPQAIVIPSPPTDQERISRLTTEDLLNNYLQQAVINSFYALEVMTRFRDLQGKIQNGKIELDAEKKKVAELLEEAEAMKKQVELAQLDKVLAEMELGTSETKVGVLERYLAAKDEDLIAKERVIAARNAELSLSKAEQIKIAEELSRVRSEQANLQAEYAWLKVKLHGKKETLQQQSKAYKRELQPPVAKLGSPTDENFTIQPSSSKPVPAFTFNLQSSVPSIPTSEPPASLQLGNNASFNGMATPTLNAAVNAKSEQPFSTDTLSTAIPSAFGSASGGKSESSGVGVIQEDDMEEEAPEETSQAELTRGSLSGFGIGSAQNPTAVKPNPFGMTFGNASPIPASSSFNMTVPPGELLRSASFSFQSPQPSQPSQLTSFGGGLTGSSASSPNGFSGGLVGSHSGFAFAAPSGVGFASLASAGGGFGGVGSAGGGFAAAASAGDGFAGVASSAGGGFGGAAAAPASSSAGIGFAGAASGGGFPSSGSTFFSRNIVTIKKITRVYYITI